MGEAGCFGLVVNSFWWMVLNTGHITPFCSSAWSSGGRNVTQSQSIHNEDETQDIRNKRIGIRI